MSITVAIATFAHLLVFVYWLGGDLGVFYLSRTVTNPQASVADRQLAVKLLLNLDMAPRIALILTFPTGALLAALSGWWPLSTPVLLALWVAALAWLGLAWRVHTSGQDHLRKLDLAVRIIVLIALLATAALASIALFLKVKIALLALALVLGLIVRRCLAPLGPGLMALASGDTDRANPLIEQSIGRSRVPVLGIWLVIATTAFIGLWKLV
ncbi:MAG: hypothetical protein AAGI15_16220 [Pseudomonadota bacterium]